MRHRLPALDWMRGLVMVLMAMDHASEAFNSGRLVVDSVFFYRPGMELDALQFLNRWLSHLCAPAFLFLAGAALALSIERKRERGAGAWRIDRDLLVRGLLILAVDLTFINLFWVPGYLLLQVMYAIGGALILMVPLRRLPCSVVMALALLILAGSELLLPGALETPLEPGAMAVSFFASCGLVGKVLVLYPLLPWWAMLALGWSLGRALVGGAESHRRTLRLLALTGGLSLLLFVLVRGANGYGNMRLLREDSSWLQWLLVSKYPPSLAFVALELGLLALLLAALFAVQRALGDRVSPSSPLLVFGQTALFFYLAHILLFELSARALGLLQRGGLVHSWVATAAGLLLLYPACLGYRRLKAAHPGSLLRFF